MNRNTILMAVLAVLVASGGVVAAATVTIDSETTDTSTVSDWQEGTVISNFSASADNQSQVEVSLDETPSDDIVVEVIETYGDDDESNDVVVREFSGEFEVTNSETNNYARNISHDSLSTIPMDAGESETFLVKVYETGDEENGTEMNVTFDNSDARTVKLIGDREVNADDSMVSLDTTKSGLFGLYGDEEDVASIDDEVLLTEDETDRTVSYVYANDDVASAATAATEGVEVGDYVFTLGAFGEGDLFQTFSGTPEDAPEDNTYVVYDTDEGYDVVTYHVSDDYDKQSFDVATALNDKPDLRDRFSVYGLDALTAWNPL